VARLLRSPSAVTQVPESHIHDAMYEAYLIAAGSATLIIEHVEHDLRAGMIAVVEPGEAHYFASKSEDFRHFVVQLSAACHV
jgi:mannose-6-phosphate isomerase-like protein (cupin superfamily)